jgi:hypothetical protein
LTGAQKYALGSQNGALTGALNRGKFDSQWDLFFLTRNEGEKFVEGAKWIQGGKNTPEESTKSRPTLKRMAESALF